MTPTLWALCPCHPDPIHVATRHDTARLEAMGAAIVGQADGCQWEWTITDSDSPSLHHKRGPLVYAAKWANDQKSAVAERKNPRSPYLPGPDSTGATAKANGERSHDR